MPANWSLMLNVLLLIGVVVAIARLIKSRRQNTNPIDSASSSSQPFLGKIENKSFDDIISVRKISQDFSDDTWIDNTTIDNLAPAKAPDLNDEEETEDILNDTKGGQSLMIFLQAKKNRKLAGYELLQTVLAAGLRFGEGQLFHRHQNANGQGPVLCSLAAATSTGMFDLQNIGAFSVRGLCLFMQTSGNSTIDEERFTIMFETAKHLSADFDTHLLDDQQRPFTMESMNRYCRILNIKTPLEMAVPEEKLELSEV